MLIGSCFLYHFPACVYKFFFYYNSKLTPRRSGNDCMPSIEHVWLEVAGGKSSQTFQKLGGCQYGIAFLPTSHWLSALWTSRSPLWILALHRSSATPDCPVGESCLTFLPKLCSICDRECFLHSEYLPPVLPGSPGCLAFRLYL